ncbi:hypothetical protein [Gemmatimonas groenlandica]|uniref:Uncharacterized protein n=1 Tax=Gemmatimonas groenlandica TaxID=2732249 RepID=A0A6M4IXE1_9BACT|nr:hypothetical protein [Gemmatimonas groenlandica]QJR37572.1 hypothetical protein HKW67_19645 [Gemmatimonas groenlandica]
MTSLNARVRRRALRALALVGAFGAVAFSAACVFYRTEVRAVERPTADAPTFIKSPLKAHLKDGSIVVFRNGATVTRESLTGEGRRYTLQNTTSRVYDRVPMDSVVGVETFENKVNAAPTVAASIAGAALGAVAAAVLAVAIFGSCPTVYADTGATGELQAEGFSYSIAPLMEQRDVDPLRVRADSTGRVRLELRNEALETHYINHIELLAVRHATGARIVPDQSGRPVLVSGFADIDSATDRAGRDVRSTLQSRDGSLYATDPRIMRDARLGDLDDWIDVHVGELPAGDSVAVVLRLRNSLLNTVLLYNGMLGGRDAADWLHEGLGHFGTTAEMALWNRRTMGLRATVDGVSRTDVVHGATARLGDVGPIAFRDVALVLPRSAVNARTARIRLAFVADNWRIDEVRVAGTVSRPAVTTLAVERVVVPTPAVGTAPVLDTAAVSAIAAADTRYLETRPSQRMVLEFARDHRSAREASPSADSTTTYMIAWQGWYREWIRGDWLANPTRTEPFKPGDAAVLTALRRWSERKDSFEREFYASRIPVR